MKYKTYLFLLLQLFACGQIPKKNTLPPHPELKADHYNVAILVMNGVYNTELVAPMDIFQHTQYRDSIRAMNVFTVGKSREPLRTFEGLWLIPDFSYLTDALPQIDVLVVPSAEHHLDTDLEDKAMIEWVNRTGKKAQFVLSLCDGAFVLAKAGLLDSVRCTTFPDDTETLRKMFPNLTVLDSISFVHDGKYITSAGGDRSFDAALYLCEHLYGKKVADRLAHGLVIDWNLGKVRCVLPR